MIFLYNVFIIVILSISVNMAQAGMIDFSKLLIDAPHSDLKEFSDVVNKVKLKLSDEAEIKLRFHHFQNWKQTLKTFHQKFKRAKFTVNKFSLMSEEEQKQFFGALPPLPRREKRNAINSILDTNAPASFDFRSYGKVTSIKNQEKCGSCWAFTTAAAIESQYLLRFNKTLDLSEQYLVNCNTQSAYQCQGGYIIDTIDFIKSNGITTEACQPYLALNGTCSTKCDNIKYFVDGYHDFGFNESTYPIQLYNYGPATMSFNVPQALMSYDSGVLEMSAEDCSKNAINRHAVLIVGYTPDYWIAKNSWGPNWGENGYFRFKRGQNFCSMTSEVVAPYITPPPSNCPQGDGITTMTDSLRTKVLQGFNAKRSEIAKGIFKMMNGSVAPPAKNMNKLDYSCDLEKAAQDFISNPDYRPRHDTYGAWKSYRSAVTLNDALIQAPQYHTFLTVSVQNGIAMATLDSRPFYLDDNATSIGCAYSNTSTIFADYGNAVFSCLVTPWQPSDAVYTIGTACSSNDDCIKPRYNKCDVSLGLCFA